MLWPNSRRREAQPQSGAADLPVFGRAILRFCPLEDQVKGLVRPSRASLFDFFLRILKLVRSNHQHECHAPTWLAILESLPMTWLHPLCLKCVLFIVLSSFGEPNPWQGQYSYEANYGKNVPGTGMDVVYTLTVNTTGDLLRRFSSCKVIRLTKSGFKKLSRPPGP
jgi:hypothetical protein